MARSKTDSFILELKLKTSPADDAYLEKCFSAGCSIYNTLVRHCRRQTASLRQDKVYRELLAEYRSLKKGKERTAISKKLGAIVASYGLTEYGLHDFVKVLQKRYKKYINSHVAQKTASSVSWKRSSMGRGSTCTSGNGRISCPWKGRTIPPAWFSRTGS